MKDPRIELARLILDGLNGRTLERLFRQVRALFVSAGESLCWGTYEDWALGKTFPATQRRQDMLAAAVGGPCGEAIHALHGLPFRGYRTRMMKEKEMNGSGHGLRGTREFVWVMRDDGSGRLVKQAEIVCSQCGATYHHYRRGKVDSDEYFRSKGWEVGRHAGHDLCSTCVANRKVVKMSDHKKPGAVEPAGQEASKKDRRVLLMFIQEHWDENIDRYQIGWSDQKIAEDTGKPVELVKAVREAEFDGPGEDPGAIAFIEQQVAVGKEMSELGRLMEELLTSVADMQAKQNEERATVARMLAGYKQHHNALSGKVTQLAKVAETLRPFDKAG